MSTSSAWLIRFVGEVFVAIRPATAWPGLAVKALGALAVAIATFTLTNRIGIVVTTANGEPMWQSDQTELRWVAFGLAFLAILIWAAGAAWVRVFTLRVSDHVRCNGNQYQISIRNLGFSVTPVLVRMEEMADENGLCEDWNVQFPIVLFHVPISRGFPHSVVLISSRVVSRYTNQTFDPRYAFDAVDVTNNREIESIGLITRNGNKIWFRISISSIDRSMWFSVQMNNEVEASQLSVICEDPPHVQRRSRWERWFSNDS